MYKTVWWTPLSCFLIIFPILFTGCSLYEYFIINNEQFYIEAIAAISWVLWFIVGPKTTIVSLEPEMIDVIIERKDYGDEPQYTALFRNSEGKWFAECGATEEEAITNFKRTLDNTTKYVVRIPRYSIKHQIEKEKEVSNDV